jgi:hypothetical protein
MLATSDDINRRLARGECANFYSNNCDKQGPCLILSGEDCNYFTLHVLPLLEYPAFADKYHREARNSVTVKPATKPRKKKTKT